MIMTVKWLWNINLIINIFNEFHSLSICLNYNCTRFIGYFNLTADLIQPIQQLLMRVPVPVIPAAGDN
jgi:hypothetical protein